MKVSEVKQDCVHFRGDIPCRPHKEEGVHCECDHYEKRGPRVLIIKLGAIGDVIRTTPLLERLRKEYKNCEIMWITRSPEVLDGPDRVLKLDADGVAQITADSYDIAYNLDKEPAACALMNRVRADEKKGFELRDGFCYPLPGAEHKYITGLFDDISKQNMKSYPEEVFEIAGFTFNGERYTIRKEDHEWPELADANHVVGLNTGCGARWRTREWPDENWVSLARRLGENGFTPLMLGGEAEHEKNHRIAEKSGALYLGHFPLTKFISLVDQCDLVVSAVTMAPHIALALGKKLVMFNNIFNPNEFEMYELGEIIEPEGCECFYKPTCHKYDIGCLEQIGPDVVYKKVAAAMERG